MMNPEFLKELTKHYHDITPEDVVGVSFGKKESGGVLTDKDAVIFTVRKKKPLDEIPEEERIPSQIEYGGVSFETDIEEGEFKFLEDCPSDFYSWVTTPPANRNKIRPLQGGLSVTNYTNLSNYVGTLGFIAVDNQTNSLVGVSNNHVLIADAFQANERSLSGVKSSIYENKVTQPNEGSNYGLQNAIGIVKRYVPLSGTSYYNSVDAALTTVNESDIDSTSYRQYGLDGWTQPLTFATTSEIDNLLSTNPNLFSAGRTTGPKGEGDMKLFADSITTTISINYNKQGVSTTIYFDNCIRFYASASTTPNGYVCTYPINAGDSGSALVADFGGTRKIIGLVFAGSYNNNNQVTRGLANRIDKVAEQIDISAWTGQTVNYSDTGNTQTYTVTGLSDEPYIDLGGNTYWQAGLTQ